MMGRIGEPVDIANAVVFFLTGVRFDYGTRADCGRWADGLYWTRLARSSAALRNFNPAYVRVGSPRALMDTHFKTLELFAARDNLRLQSQLGPL
jgi:hypothetical protein